MTRITIENGKAAVIIELNEDAISSIVVMDGEEAFHAGEDEPGEERPNEGITIPIEGII